MIKIIKFFLFDDLNYRVNYTSEGIDKNITSAILNLFLSYFIKGVNTGVLYKKIEGKYLLLKVEIEENNEYVIKFAYLDSLSDYPIKIMYEKGFIDRKFKHSEYENLEFDTLSRYMRNIDAFLYRETVSALFRAKYYNSAIRIRGNIKDLIIWIAAIQTIFPKEFAEGITFKLEQYKNDIGVASLSISDNLIDIRYRIHLDTEVNDIAKYKFTSLLEMQYLMPSSNLKSFFVFLTNFDYKELDERLEDIYSIYMITRVGIGEADYTTVKLAFDTLDEIGTKEAKRIAVLNMLKIIDMLAGEMSIKLFELIMSFTFKASKEMESLFINELSKQLYIKSLLSILFSGRYKSPEIFEQAIELVESNQEKKDLYKYILDDRRLEDISIYLNIDIVPERALIMLKYLLNASITLGHKWDKLSEKFMEIVNRSIVSISKEEINILELFDVLLLDEGYFSSVSIGIFESIENEAIQEDFISQIVKFNLRLDEEKVIEVRKRMSFSDSGIRLLYEEFKCFAMQTGYKTEDFKEYVKSFYAATAYFNKCFSRAVAHMYSNIEEKEAYNLSMFMAGEIKEKKFNISALPDKSLIEIVLGIEKNVDFANCDDVYEFLDVLGVVKRDRNIKTSINITNLLMFQKLIAEGESINPLDYELFDMTPNRLSEDSYKKYKEINLSKIIGMCKDKEEHKAVADSFMTKDDFIFEYMQIALNDENIEKDSAIGFIIYYIYYIHPVYKVSGKEEILMELRNMMIERISELSFTTTCEIDDKVKAEFQEENLSMPVEWEEIFSSIKKIKSEGNFVNKIKFMMKK